MKDSALKRVILDIGTCWCFQKGVDSLLFGFFETSKSEVFLMVVLHNNIYDTVLKAEAQLHNNIYVENNIKAK